MDIDAIPGKLVRDLIPEIIRATGGDPQTRVLSSVQYRQALIEKLLEEAREVSEADSAHLVEEMADVLEVLRNLAAESEIDWDDVEAARQEKLLARGGFHLRIWLGASPE